MVCLAHKKSDRPRYRTALRVEFVRNLFLDDHTTADINGRIDRIHKDLRLRDRIDLASVRDLLRLDLGYYKSDDPQLAAEVVHSLKIGAKRIVDAPRMLLETVKKFDLRALLLWKPRRIFIDENLHDIKKRWSEGHEIAHSLLPWHEEYLLGDDQSTLSPACHERIEAEANYACGRLLFPAKIFTDLSASSTPSMAHVSALSKQFGNSITTTLWRYVENSSGLKFGIISQHPHYRNEDEPDVKYLILSRQMFVEFPALTEQALFDAMKTYCTRRRGGPLGIGLSVATNANGEKVTFHMDSFANTHQVLTLGWHANERS
jgi:Zn-dependent peptidase ImmA (M78 family)